MEAIRGVGGGSNDAAPCPSPGPPWRTSAPRQNAKYNQAAP